MSLDSSTDSNDKIILVSCSDVLLAELDRFTKTEKDNDTKQHSHHHCGCVNAMHGQIKEKVI